MGTCVRKYSRGSSKKICYGVIPMNNLKEYMKSDVPSYSKKQERELTMSALNMLGEDKYLTICIEELAELNEVITSNTLSKVDYIHTVEEIVDVMFCMDVIKLICGLSNSQLKKKSSKIKKKNVLITSVRNIAKSQQNISKYIRWKKDGYDKAVDALNLLNETIPVLIDFFKIKKKDLEKMRNIKIKRLEERVMYGTLH